jgi:hypothetical protein
MALEGLLTRSRESAIGPPTEWDEFCVSLGRSDWPAAKLLMVLASRVIFGFQSHEIHDHISFLSFVHQAQGQLYLFFISLSPCWRPYMCR